METINFPLSSIQRERERGSKGLCPGSFVRRFQIRLFKFFFFIFKDRNGDQIWFTVACYGKGYCQVLMSASQGKNRFTTQIATETVPAEVNFFSEDEELFLMIVKDPCVLYR